jgi:hypothetical protein
MGTVQVIKDGIQRGLLSDGQSFGETVLYVTVTKRTATVITRSYCQVLHFIVDMVCMVTCMQQVDYASMSVQGRPKQLLAQNDYSPSQRNH